MRRLLLLGLLLGFCLCDLACNKEGVGPTSTGPRPSRLKKPDGVEGPGKVP